MKFHTLTALCTIACAAIATAQVPSLINYQGRLTNANGDPVTGSKNFAISIYDAATNGTLLYTETIGAVTLDDNGVYSFQFGGTGTSNTLVTETVATTNGTSTTFQKVIDNSPVVANSVSVSDGTYTWSQSAGSSNEDDFGVAYSTSLRRVTANYYNGAPVTGRTITATYRYGTNGITGALTSGAEHWMAISVDGTVQGTRQRVLAVPFAQRAAVADVALSGHDTEARNQIAELLVSTSAGRSVELSKALQSGVNYNSGVIQATKIETFSSTFGGTFQISPEAGSSKNADYFLIGKPSGSQGGWYEVEYADSQVIRVGVESTDQVPLIVLNPQPQKEVAYIRCSFSTNIGGATTTLAIFTPSKTTATFSISGAPNVARGAIALFSSNGSQISDMSLILGLQDGRSIQTTPGVFVPLGSPITSIRVTASSPTYDSKISKINLHY